MEGVEILHVYQVATDWEYNWTTFWIVLGITLVISIVLGLHDHSCCGDWSVIIAFAIMGLIVGTLFAVFVGSVSHLPTEYVSEYKVTVSDDVSLVDFYERYEIRGQEGNIYIVRERELS